MKQWLLEHLKCFMDGFMALGGLLAVVIAIIAIASLVVEYATFAWAFVVFGVVFVCTMVGKLIHWGIRK